MKVEGKNAVRELLKTNRTVEKLLVENGLNDYESKRLIESAKKNRIVVSYVDKKILDKESESKKHQGFIAYVTDFKYTDIEDIVSSADENSLIVLADEVSDPHNLGSIIRVLECAGADGLIITERRSATVNDTVMRISEGAANHLKIAKEANINDAIDYLKENGFWVYGAEIGGESIYDTDFSGKTAIVVGSEGFGIKRLTKEKCDKIITIPMRGKVNSLNVSVACGIAVFEAVRKKNAK